MFDFEKPNIEIVEISDDKKYGRFVCEPLERGYGTTLGNALKRIMLSALPGTAVSQVKIIGADKESDTIPGVKDTLTEVIMNLKSLNVWFLKIEHAMPPLLQANYFEYNSTISISFTGTSISSLEGSCFTVALRFSWSASSQAGTKRPFVTSRISLNL